MNAPPAEPEVIADLKPDDMQSQTVIGSDEEIQAIETAWDAPLEGDAPPPEPTPPPAPDPAAPATPPVDDGTIEIDGVRISKKTALNAHQAIAEATRRNQEAAEARREFQAEQQRLAQRLEGLINERLPAPPPAPPAPIAVDLTSIGPRPDLTTLEGQEAFPEWDQKRMELVMQATREAVLKDVTAKTPPGVKPEDIAAAVQAEQQRTARAESEAYNANLAADFLARAAEFDLTPATASATLAALKENTAEFSDIKPTGFRNLLGTHFTIEDLAKAGRKVANMDQINAVSTAETERLKGIQRAQAASGVQRGGGAPAAAPALSLKALNAMPEAEFRKRYGGLGKDSQARVQELVAGLRKMGDSGFNIEPGVVR